MKTKILCTGSCGFVIGNYIRRGIYKNKSEYTFVSIDRANRNINSLYWNKNHTFHIGNISDSEIVNTIFKFEKPDIVIHGAANTNREAPIQQLINDNIIATQNIIDAAVANNVQRIISFSTSKPVATERYEMTKKMSESLFDFAAKNSSLKFNILKSCDIFGQRQSMSKFVPNIIKSILAGESIKLSGDGSTIREWMHVYDLCSAIDTIIEKSDVVGNGDFNISTGYEISDIELVNLIAKIMDKSYQVVFDKSKADNPLPIIQSTDIRNIGWAPEVKLKAGLQEVCDWYNVNQWMFK